MCVLELEREFLSVAQLAELLGVSPKTIRAWVAAGRLPPPLRLSERTLRFERGAVMQCLGALGRAAADGELD